MGGIKSTDGLEIAAVRDTHFGTNAQGFAVEVKTVLVQESIGRDEISVCYGLTCITGRDCVLDPVIITRDARNICGTEEKCF